MKIINTKTFKVSIHKSGHFYWKPEECPHISSMADMRYSREGCIYKVTHYFVPHFVQFFWLWFILAVEIKRKKLSESEYVRYEDTHYAMIEEALNNK